MTGTIIMQERGITKTYRFLGDKAYSISKSLEGKVKDYEGQQVTLFGTFYIGTITNKVLKIDGITK